MYWGGEAHSGNQTDLLKDCCCLSVYLSVANKSSSSTGPGGLKELENLNSHTLVLEVQVLQAPKVLTVRPPLSWAGNGNSSSEGISATKSCIFFQTGTKSNIKTFKYSANKVTVLGLTSCCDFRVYFRIICSLIYPGFCSYALKSHSCFCPRESCTIRPLQNPINKNWGSSGL